MVYYALVDSILNYGLACWGGAYITTIKPLYIRQKHIVRIISFKEMTSPSRPIFQSLDILPLRHLYVFKVLRVVYTISGNSFVNYNDHNLRCNSLFKKHVPSFKTMQRRYFFNVISPIIFNNLPYDIRLCASFKTFLKALKIWLGQTSDIERLLGSCV